jgi:transcriptional regulator with XRE-family HTH domain
MELAERFRYIMKLNQLSASAFADEIGVQRSSISHILSGRNKPSLEFIQKILTRFPKVDASWLISGATQPESSEFRVQSSEDEIISTNIKPIIEDSVDVESEEANSLSKSTKRGRIKKIVVFYDDQTFEEFNP